MKQLQEIAKKYGLPLRKEYSKKDMISGGISENKDQNFKNLKEIIHVEGGNIKNQINYALVEGLKKEN